MSKSCQKKDVDDIEDDENKEIVEENPDEEVDEDGSNFHFLCFQRIPFNTKKNNNRNCRRSKTENGEKLFE